MEGLSQVWGYGELIKCEQEKPKGANAYDSGPCKLTDEISFFIIKLTETEDCRVVKMRKQCLECSCNKGPVEVYWKPRAL
ncbi:MAG: hypothetical protein HPY74_20805 [Firmicutes bacterium]|nr:hypothetical protein [Bacillota bacterium]